MLKGKELQDRARELNIPMRSKMTADELRAAVEQYETVGPVYNPNAYDNRSAPGPIGNDSRERNYREQAVIRSGGKTFAYGNITPGSVKLTHRQKRRLKKKARKHGGVS